MITEAEAKALVDNDLDVLSAAYESDKEYANAMQKIIVTYVSKIFEVLIQKGVLTEQEALEHLKEANNIINEGELE